MDRVVTTLQDVRPLLRRSSLSPAPSLQPLFGQSSAANVSENLPVNHFMTSISRLSFYSGWDFFVGLLVCVYLVRALTRICRMTITPSCTDCLKEPFLIAIGEQILRMLMSNRPEPNNVELGSRNLARTYHFDDSGNTF